MKNLIIIILSYVLAFLFVIGTFWTLGDYPFEVVVFVLFTVIYAQDIMNHIKNKR